jgi:hypothetical protein
MKMIIFRAGDDEYAIRNMPGFVPASQYAGLGILQGEIGAVSGIRFVSSEDDHEIHRQRTIIKEQIEKLAKRPLLFRTSSNEKKAALQAQCAMLGHRVAVIKSVEKDRCFYCGAKIS